MLALHFVFAAILARCLLRRWQRGEAMSKLMLRCFLQRDMQIQPDMNASTRGLLVSYKTLAHALGTRSGGLLLFLSYTLTRRLYFAETGLVIEPWRVPY